MTGYWMCKDSCVTLHSFSGVSLSSGCHSFPLEDDFFFSINLLPWADPLWFTLQDSAVGELYLDDGHSFQYLHQNQFSHRRFSFCSGVLTSRWGSYKPVAFPRLCYPLTSSSKWIAQVLSLYVADWEVVCGLKSPGGFWRGSKFTSQHPCGL